MGSDRQIIADQILKAIDYGNLPKDEIERRLEQIIDTELNVPLNAEVNQEKVDLCNSLLHQLYTHGKFEYNDSIEESKQKVIRKLNARKRRAIALKYAIRSIAAALILVVGLSLLNVLPPIRWFTGTSTDDEQQYVVQGHVISTQTIANAIAAHNESDALATQSIEEANEFLGFRINFPESIHEMYYPAKYYVYIMPEYIRISCNYETINNVSENTDISLSVTLFTNLENTYLQYEQDIEGVRISVSHTDIYRYENIGQVGYIWIKDNVLYRLVHDTSMYLENEILTEIIDWRFM